MAADPRGEGIDDLLAREGSPGPPRHLRDEAEYRYVVDDVPDNRLPFPHAGVQELAAELRDADVPVLDGHEAEEFRGTEDGTQAVQVHVDFLRNRGDVCDAADFIDRLHETEDLAHGHLRDRMEVGHAARPSNAFAAIRHLTSSLQTMSE